MQVLNLDEKNTERMDAINKFTLMDDTFMTQVFSSDDIYEHVWNETAVNTETVMVHIRNLREKIEINPRAPRYIKVVWGVGYKIEKQ